jgi:hypothetical protein
MRSNVFEVAFLGLAVMTLAAGAAAQSSSHEVNVRTQAAIISQAQVLRSKAQASPDGLAPVTLEKFPGHLTMLIVRTKNGGAEVHNAVTDIIVAEEGDATVVTGGTVEGGKEISPGEIRGVKVNGGTPHVIHKGDIMHIGPGIPHQVMVPAGKTFAYYVIKVDKPSEK